MYIAKHEDFSYYNYVFYITTTPYLPCNNKNINRKELYDFYYTAITLTTGYKYGILHCGKSDLWKQSHCTLPTQLPNDWYAITCMSPLILQAFIHEMFIQQIVSVQAYGNKLVITWQFVKQADYWLIVVEGLVHCHVITNTLILRF